MIAPSENNKLLRPAYLEVDLGALAYNIRNIKKRLGRDVELMVIVKADGYGHGAYEVAKLALENGAGSLGVAILEEGIQLREKGIKAPIANLFPEPPKRAEKVVEYGLDQIITDLEFVKRLSQEAKKQNKCPNIFIEIDTGLGRYGVPPQETIDLVKKIKRIGNVRLKGIFSQFSTADQRKKDFAFHQLSVFKKTLDELESLSNPAKGGISNHIPIKSIANSGAVLDIPASYFNHVRVGHLLYGLYPSLETSESIKVKPAMSLKSKVIFIKEVEKGTPISYGKTYIAKKKTKIATIPLGYADGYSWLLSNKGEVLIRGKRAKVVGRVCMDAFMVDVSGIPEVKLGDEVVVMGRQGNDEITAHDLGTWTNTFAYEIMTRMGKRLPVVYIKRHT
ncbi:MAG: alanine racemase [candidate division Zixibacteria bacterium]|nr:alanine racemase [candidate division Zixibacteria bacterium]